MSPPNVSRCPFSCFREIDDHAGRGQLRNTASFSVERHQEAVDLLRDALAEGRGEVLDLLAHHAFDILSRSAYRMGGSDIGAFVHRQHQVLQLAELLDQLL